MAQSPPPQPPSGQGRQPLTAMSASTQQDPQRAATLAPNWFDDALCEARTQGVDARRREILFAVCVAESYLFEWVRDHVLERSAFANLEDYHRTLNNYFPLGYKRDIARRWKDVIESLHGDHRLPRLPDFSSANWQDFRDLVDYRNGLTHAGSHRALSDQLLHLRRSEPFIKDLESLQPGAALSVVITLIRELHQTSATLPPPWLVEP